jgi:hypothetical protein
MECVFRTVFFGSPTVPTPVVPSFQATEIIFRGTRILNKFFRGCGLCFRSLLLTQTNNPGHGAVFCRA